MPRRARSWPRPRPPTWPRPGARKRELKERYGVAEAARVARAPSRASRRRSLRRSRRRLERASWPRTWPRPRPRRAAGRTWSATRTRSSPPSSRASRPRGSGYADGIRSVTPGLGPDPRRPPAADGGRPQGLQARHPRDLLLARCSTSMDRLLAATTARGPLVRDVEPRAAPAHGPGADLAAMRRAAAEADEWITVDTLAHPYGDGHPARPRRWAELEQLVYSPSRWERRLVGSTLATMPHVNGVAGGARARWSSSAAWRLVGQLIGDAEPDVQKALSWALRTLADAGSRRPSPPSSRPRPRTARRDRRRQPRLGHPRQLSKLPADAAARLRASSTASAADPAPHRRRSAAAAAAEFASAATPAAAARRHSSGRNSAP